MGHGQSHKSGRNTYYTNAKVSFENGGVDAFFFADFCTVKGGRSYISDIYADHIHVDEGYYDKNSKFFKITQRSENGQTGAKALLKFTAHIYQTSTGGGAGGVNVNATNGASTQDYSLQLNVLNNSYNARAYY